jgi:hypothetical protein
MRLFFATILMALVATNAASASSFVTPEEVTTPDSPSIITLGASPSFVAAGEPDESPRPSIERFGGPATEDRKFVTVSPSVIAMVDAPQPVAFENVASIGDDEKARKRARESMPMVIRGGIVGDAFSSGSGSAPASERAAEPRPQQQVSAPPSGGNGPKPSGPDEPSGPRVPKSALPPAAPPTGRME